MSHFDRRAFLGISAGALAVLRDPQAALAQTTCVTGGLPGFLPTYLTVDCASRRNFLLFRKNTVYLGLTGVVTMTFVRAKFGTFEAGNLSLFPWLKPKGRALGAAKVWGAVMPTSATAMMSAAPIPDWTLPLDEYFLRYRLQAPWPSYIGFRVDEPFGINDARRPWFTNVDKLADGKGVGIAWTSSNLNDPWFGGSRWIPQTAFCNGAPWRKLIIDGLNRASMGMC